MVVWRGAEHNSKNIVQVRAIHVKPLCTCRLVFQFVGIYIEKFYFFSFFQHEAMNLISNFQVVSWSVLASWYINTNLVALSSTY